MSTFDFPPSIKSRPVWGRLEARAGKHHLMIADAEGAEAIIAIATPDLMARTHIIFIAKGTSHGDALRALNPAQFYEGPTYAASVQRIRRVFQDAHMGLQVYLAGTEGVMGQAMREAIEAGIPHTAIQTEHRGSVARRMQCVHCKGITEDVETDPFVCAHCGLNLFVRDHYSRRLAAYQGVRVDAEDHGNVPEPRGIYE
ncbi:dimethylamine monooxygenase subunit DmmA family protein [uncultured Roseobacter sp.]|uniref:dimethylamine monooxygenase subunit DmmA family protein n=1 Tax=uncultured Roseobacter sp. TaxID=114847 RepID=UPI0026169127|nr:dimethylamine monooxygenase subunit DmmA family protein [uncultured Roseobacter sp.]